jgi:hypothetical protein
MLLLLRVSLKSHVLRPVRRGSPDPAAVSTAGLPALASRLQDLETYRSAPVRGRETRAQQVRGRETRAQQRISCFGFRIWLLAGLMTAAIALPVAAQDSAATASPEQAVEAGRDALNRGWLSRLHNWYDEDTDGVRRIDFEIPKPPSNWNWKWGNVDFSWLGYLFNASGWMLLGLFILGLVTLLVLAYLRRERSEALPIDAEGIDDETSDVDRVEALPFRMARQTLDPLSEARRAYEGGAFDEAIVYLFSYQLIELDRQQIIRLARGKTNRQCVNEIGPRRALKRLVETTMVAFEDVFFGGHPLSRARFEACWLELDTFQRLVAEEHS